MAYETAGKGNSNVQATVDKALKKSSDTKAAKGAVSSAKKKKQTNSDALAKAYQQGVMDALYAQQLSQQAPTPGLGAGEAPEMPFTQGAPPEAPPGMPPEAGPGAGAPAMVPPPPGMGGPPPGMPGLPPMPGGGPLPPGLAPSQPIAPGPLGALGPNAVLRSTMPRL